MTPYDSTRHELRRILAAAERRDDRTIGELLPLPETWRLGFLDRVALEARRATVREREARR